MLNRDLISSRDALLVPKLHKDLLELPGFKQNSDVLFKSVYETLKSFVCLKYESVMQ